MHICDAGHKHCGGTGLPHAMNRIPKRLRIPVLSLTAVLVTMGPIAVFEAKTGYRII